MSSKDEILRMIRGNTTKQCDMPLLDIQGVTFVDRLEQLINACTGVGAKAVVLQSGEDVNGIIRGLFPYANSVASNLDEIMTTINPNDVDKPHSLNGVEVAVVRGAFAVAENGAVWIPQNVKERAIYFICEHLIILVGRNDIVNNMHEAYSRIGSSDFGFGVFISGPSKTADIEQALVMGAHGARSVAVVIE